MRTFHLLFTLAAAGLLAITGAGCTAGAKKIYHLHRANRYFDSGQYDGAEVEYMNVLRNDRQNTEAISRLGVIYYEEGRYQRAAPFLLKGSRLATNNLDLRLKLGFICLALGNAKEARDEAGFILDRKPQDNDAPLLLADSARTKNEIEEARQRLHALSQNGDRAILEVALGTLAFRERDFKAAEAAFERAQKLDPKSSEAYAALGALSWAQNDLKQAETDFKTAAELSPLRSPNRLQYARFETQTGNLAAAKNILGEMVKKTPDYIPAWIGLAEIALAEKKFDDCAASLSRALARDPDNYDALLLKSRLDLARGETATAIAELERMEKTYPQSPRVHYLLGLAYLMNNGLVEGVNSLKEAVRLDPGFSEAILLLAEMEIKNGDPNSAVVSLKQLIQHQPEMMQARLFLADAYRVQGNPDDALAIYRELEKSFPTNSQVPLLMGSTLLLQKDNAGARKEFVRALELAPDNLPALEQLVDLDLTEKQYSAAMQRVEGAVEKNPKQAEMRLLLAKIFLTQGETNQAETALSKAIELQPEFQTAYLLLAQLYADTDQNTKALAILGAAIEKNPKNAAAMMLTATIHESEKHYQAAADAYEKTLEINPQFGPALNNLACLYSEHLGQLDKAYELAQRSRELLPNDPSTADTLGWILCKKGQYAAAVALLRESARQLPSEPEIQFHLGMAQYMMDDENAARAAFQRALQSNRDFSDRDECNRCLSVLAIDPKTAGNSARASLEKRIAEKPGDPVALARLAAIYQQAGDLNKAIEMCESILKIYPDNVKVMINLAQLYSPNDLQKSLDLAKSAYKLAPDDPDVSYTLGRLTYQAGDYNWAFSLLQEAAQNQPDNPKVLHDFAEAAYSVGKTSQAQAAMQSALQAGLPPPQSDEAQHFLDMISLAGNPARAIAMESHVDEILKSNPDDVPALMVAALINEQKTNTTTAEQAFEKILTRYPDFTPAQRELAILYSENSINTERAYALAIKARDALPDDSGLAKALGIILFQQGDYARAESLLKATADERSADAELFYYLGVAQYHFKNLTDSKASLMRALNLNLSGQMAANAKQILAGMK